MFKRKSDASNKGVSTLLKVKELSQRLSVPEGTLRRWVLNKEIPYIKVGPGKRGAIRFDEAEVRKYIASRSNLPKKKGVKTEMQLEEVEVTTVEELMKSWDEEENYMEKMLNNYRLYKPGKGEIYAVDFNIKAGGKRIRKTLKTNDKELADKRAKELIRLWFKQNA